MGYLKIRLLRRPPAARLLAMTLEKVVIRAQHAVPLRARDIQMTQVTVPVTKNVTGTVPTTTLNLTMWRIQKFKPLRSWMSSTRVRIGTSCGGGEIRTLGGLTPTTVFKTAAFDRSATPPKYI